MRAATWMTRSGWAVVVDALTVGGWHDNEEGRSHTRPPTDYDADHLLVRGVRCIQGRVPIELVCEPDFAYGATPARWSPVENEQHFALDAVGDSQPVRLRSDIRLGIEGNRAHGRHTL